MHGYMPSLREMCMFLGLKSLSGAFNLLGILEAKHYIRREKERARAIEILINPITGEAKHANT